MLNFGKRLRGRQVRRLNHSRTNRETSMLTSSAYREEVSKTEIARELFQPVGKGLSRHEQGRKEDATEEGRQLG